MAFNFIVLNIYFSFSFMLLLLPVQSLKSILRVLMQAAVPKIENATDVAAAATADMDCLALAVQNSKNVYLNLNYCKFAQRLKTLFYICRAFAFLFYKQNNSDELCVCAFFFSNFSYLHSPRPCTAWANEIRAQKIGKQQEKTIIKRNKVCYVLTA